MFYSNIFNSALEAYLVLYRRCDHEPGQLCQGRRTPGVPRRAPELSEELQRCVV